MRTGLVALLVPLQVAVATAALAQPFPGMTMHGVDPEVRRLMTSDEPVGFVARCVVAQVRASYLSTSQEERRRFEQGASGLTAAMPAVADATGVARDAALSVLGLATMPLSTFSVGLVPGADAKGDGLPDKACTDAARDPDAYVGGLTRR